MAPEVRPRAELLREPGARQRLPHRQAVALEAGVAPLPERRRGRQGQQMGQEVADLVH